jgi:UDP-glucuronate decarboxylase
VYSKVIEEDCKYILSQADNLKWLQGKTLFITGVNGLIASYLVEVIYYANKRNKKPITLFGIYRSESDRLNHVEDENIILTKRDVMGSHSIKADYILNLACNSSPEYFTKYPVETIMTNIRSVNWLLEAASTTKATMIQFSTGEVAGHPEVIPTPESYEGKSLTSDLRGAYIESKRCAEAFCWAYHRQYGVKFKIIRPFIIYGPGYKKDDLRVIPTFIRSALTKKEINIKSNGSETRAFCYIADAITQILRIMALKDSDTFNIGSQAETSILTLASIVMMNTLTAEVDSHYLNVGKEAPAGALRVCPDMSKTLKAINYENHYSLDSGIDRTIQYFKEVL